MIPINNNSTRITCFGDSGSGLLFQIHPKDYLVGIHSFDIDCPKWPTGMQLIHYGLDWIYSKTKIMNGNFAKKGQFPYHVLLREIRNECSGSIISSLWVLTAAHCIKGFVA